MKEMVIMVGAPGSGKSVYVNKHFLRNGYQIVCRDDIRLALGFEFEPRHEQLVLSIVMINARAHLERGLPVVIDETNTTLTTLNMWKNLAVEYGYSVKFFVIYQPLEVCKQRRGVYEGKFPEEVVERMHDQLEFLLREPEYSEIWSDGILNIVGGFNNVIDIKREGDLPPLTSV